MDAIQFFDYEDAVTRGAEVTYSAYGGPIFDHSLESKERLAALYEKVKIPALYWDKVSDEDMTFAFESRDFFRYRGGICFDAYREYCEAAERLLAELGTMYDHVDAVCLESPDGKPAWVSWEEEQ